MIHIDCWTEILDWSQYDLSKDEVYVVDNLFLGGSYTMFTKLL